MGRERGVRVWGGSGVRVCGRERCEGVWGLAERYVIMSASTSDFTFLMSSLSLPDKGGSNRQRSSLRPLSLIS